MTLADRQKFRSGLVQLTSKGDMAANITAAEKLIRQAVAEGADFVMTPEVTSLLETDAKLLIAKLYSQEDDPALAAFRALALELKIWLLIGSQAFRLENGKLANRSLLINAAGEITARYDKIHMFDVDLPGGESYRESKRYQPGTEAVLAPTPWGLMGLSVCYDLRFPALYRAYAQAGADFLTAPSAFTAVTGQAHWHVLLRARAIETGCYMFAPAQYGDHGGGRVTYGHSLVVDPWGQVVADGGQGNGIVMADIDPARVVEARQRIPSLQNDAKYRLIKKARF
jgi:predicted amidohydrolase